MISVHLYTGLEWDKSYFFLLINSHATQLFSAKTKKSEKCCTFVLLSWGSCQSRAELSCWCKPHWEISGLVNNAQVYFIGILNFILLLPRFKTGSLWTRLVGPNYNQGISIGRSENKMFKWPDLVKLAWEWIVLARYSSCRCPSSVTVSTSEPKLPPTLSDIIEESASNSLLYSSAPCVMSIVSMASKA